MVDDHIDVFDISREIAKDVVHAFFDVRLDCSFAIL